ncbi:RsmE family RNA methyltransferase [Ilumatobacter sp.]|uniref:RsmE family RNA methyltransferase n=1 Tax=Ilumatobacter sp. TaxID=1967498 RepID=UPI003B51BFD5
MGAGWSDERRRSAAHVLLPPGSTLDGGPILLPDDVEHHLRRVLRLRDGSGVSITDGAGRWCSGRVRSTDPTLTIEVTGDVRAEVAPTPFTLATAVPKGDRLDWLVQKVSELGASRIVLIEAERSNLRWSAAKADKQRRRLGRIADEAVRQSRRVWRTTVEGPVDADEVLRASAVAEPAAPPPTGSERAIAIGPEGGWTDRELSSASSSVGLGDNILRIETAAVVATALRMVSHHATSVFDGPDK